MSRRIPNTGLKDDHARIRAGHYHAPGLEEAIIAIRVHLCPRYYQRFPLISQEKRGLTDSIPGSACIADI